MCGNIVGPGRHLHRCANPGHCSKADDVRQFDVRQGKRRNPSPKLETQDMSLRGAHQSPPLHRKGATSCYLGKHLETKTTKDTKSTKRREKKRRSPFEFLYFFVSFVLFVVSCFRLRRKAAPRRQGKQSLRRGMGDCFAALAMTCLRLEPPTRTMQDLPGLDRGAPRRV